MCAQYACLACETTFESEDEHPTCPHCGSENVRRVFGYICMKCGETVMLDPNMPFGCSKCGSRIFKKERPPVLKKVKAR